MNKQSFQGALCVLASVLLAVIIITFMFVNLDWPGRDLLLAIIIPAMMAILSINLCIYVGKYGALTTVEGKAKSSARFLLIVEKIALIVLVVFFTAIIFRLCHWPFGAQLLMLSCVSLALLSLVAGLGANNLLRNK